MTELERIEEERFIEALISMWISYDAPSWIKDYVREELRKGHGVVEVAKEEPQTERKGRKMTDAESMYMLFDDFPDVPDDFVKAAKRVIR